MEEEEVEVEELNNYNRESISLRTLVEKSKSRNEIRRGKKNANEGREGGNGEGEDGRRKRARDAHRTLVKKS